MPQTVATQVARQMLHSAMLKRFVTTVTESRNRFYFPQRFLQLVSPRFWPLQGMLYWVMIPVTYLATALRDKLHKKLHSVTAPQVHNEKIDN